MIRLAVLYDTKTGNTEKAAAAIAAGMNSVENAEARVFSLSEVDEEYMDECCGIVFGSPTYMAGPTADFYSWFEKEAGKLKLAGKLGGAFATGRYIHGGEDLTINVIIDHMLVKGMIVYSGGAAFGHPIIHVGPVAINWDEEQFGELFRIYGNRFARQAVQLFDKGSLND